MDPNLPTQPTKPTSSPQPSSRRNIIIISVLVLIALLLGGIFYINSKKSSPQKTPQVIKPTPTPTSISKPAPVTINTIRGKVTNLLKNSLTVKTGTDSAIFNISQTKDFQRLVSGTLEGGNAKTEPVTIADLKVGQEILIITKLSSSDVISVLIVK